MGREPKTKGPKCAGFDKGDITEVCIVLFGTALLITTIVCVIYFPPPDPTNVTPTEQKSTTWISHDALADITFDNTSPNAMIWASFQILAINGSSQLENTFGSLSLSYSTTPAGEKIIELPFQVDLNQAQTKPFIVSLSTCSVQYSGSSFSLVNLGTKEGQWTWKYDSLDSATDQVSYQVELVVGSQPGELKMGSEYAMKKAVAPVMYFDFDLSSLDNSSLYDVTFSFSGTSSELKWLQGVAARASSCPEFSLDHQPLQVEGQTFVPVEGAKSSLDVSFSGLPAELCHLAILSSTATSSSFSVSWSASKASPTGDYVVLGAVTLTLAVVAVVLVGLVIGLGIKLRNDRKKALPM